MASSTTSQDTVDENQPLLSERQKIDRRSTILIFISLTLSVFVASLDETIVATAAVSIVSQYKAFHLYPWIAVTYLVCLNASQPLYGKLSDIYGRRPAILFGIVVFLLGSVGCAWAPNIEFFLISRCAAGIGAGGMNGMPFIIVADIFPLRERPKYQSMLLSAFGVACVTGPILGGVITKTLGWRWCFIINIPICIIAFLAVSLFLHVPRPAGQLDGSSLKRVDFLGAFTLVVGVVGFMIPMTLGGTYFLWTSPAMYAMVGVAVLSLAAFVLVEHYVAIDPIVPLRLFKNRNLVGAWLTIIFYGMVFFSIMYYLPVWFEVVEGNTPEQIGLQLVPLLVGLVSVGIFYSPLTHTVSKVKSIPPHCTLMYSGGVTVLFGIILRTMVNRSTSKLTESLFLLILGVGGGLVVQTSFIIGQASVAPSDIAVANSLTVFFETLGGAFGLSISGTVNRLELSRLFSLIPATLIDPDILHAITQNPRLVHTAGVLNEYTREVVINDFVESLLLTFRVCIIFGVMVFLTGSLIDYNKITMGDEEPSD